MLYSLLLGLLLALPLAAQDSPPAALAADDQVVFVRKGDLWSVRGDGSGLRQITRTAVQELRPVASPDGSLIAYEVYDADRGDFGLWTCTPEGGDPTQIIERARNVSWSPDGGRLLFAMQRRSRLDIWMANRQGTDLVRITNTPEQDYLPVWSPAGDRVAFVRELHEGGRTRYAIVVRSADGNEQEVTSLLGRNIASLSWAPSESLLYSARGEAPNEPERLYRLAAGSDRGDSLSEGPDGETLPTWVPGARGLVYAELRRGQPRLMVRGLEERGRSLPGAQDGDTEPTVLPGAATRAPHLYVLGRRVFSLPTPRLIEQELLLPLDELARQLSLELKPENDRFLLSSPQHSIIVEPVTGEVAINTAVGPERRGLVPPPQTVAGVVMVPLRQLAELFGLKTSWDAGTRTMRVGG